MDRCCINVSLRNDAQLLRTSKGALVIILQQLNGCVPKLTDGNIDMYKFDRDFRVLIDKSRDVQSFEGLAELILRICD